MGCDALWAQTYILGGAMRGNSPRVNFREGFSSMLTYAVPASYGLQMHAGPSFLMVRNPRRPCEFQGRVLLDAHTHAVPASYGLQIHVDALNSPWPDTQFDTYYSIELSTYVLSWGEVWPTSHYASMAFYIFMPHVTCKLFDLKNKCSIETAVFCYVPEAPRLKVLPHIS
jgi:hypothetical protein